MLNEQWEIILSSPVIRIQHILEREKLHACGFFRGNLKFHFQLCETEENVNWAEHSMPS